MEDARHAVMEPRQGVCSLVSESHAQLNVEPIWIVPHRLVQRPLEQLKDEPSDGGIDTSAHDPHAVGMDDLCQDLCLPLEFLHVAFAEAVGAELLDGHAAAPVDPLKDFRGSTLSELPCLVRCDFGGRDHHQVTLHLLDCILEIRKPLPELQDQLLMVDDLRRDRLQLQQELRFAHLGLLEAHRQLPCLADQQPPVLDGPSQSDDALGEPLLPILGGRCHDPNGRLDSLDAVLELLMPLPGFLIDLAPPLP
mmetsp:Transcript_138447/g.430518  ORF Transcript_138447/g.430518 Transcript_138447/m.430518 type:complete len:251 (+) Transcript_138447:906-1658(+)